MRYIIFSVIIIIVIIMTLQQPKEITKEIFIKKIVEVEKVISDPNLQNTISQLEKENEKLIIQNTKYENMIKKLCTIGKFPKNYKIAKYINKATYTRTMEYQGIWLGTMYAPTVQECSNDKGITKYGIPVTPGVTIAIDPKYWKVGTELYIEGIGYVRCEDTGSAIKGKKRFALAVKLMERGIFGAFL